MLKISLGRLNKINAKKDTENSAFFKSLRAPSKGYYLYYYLFATSHILKLLQRQYFRNDYLHLKNGELFDGLKQKEITYLFKGLAIMQQKGEIKASLIKDKEQHIKCHFLNTKQKVKRHYYNLSKYKRKLDKCIKAVGGPAKSNDLLILFLNYIKYKFNESKYFAPNNYINGFGRSCYYSYTRRRKKCEQMLTNIVNIFNKEFGTKLKVISDTTAGIYKVGMRLVFDGVKKVLTKVKQFLEKVNYKNFKPYQKKKVRYQKAPEKIGPPNFNKLLSNFKKF